MHILIVKTIFTPTRTFYKRFVDSVVKLDLWINLHLKYHTNPNLSLKFTLLLTGWINTFENDLDAFVKLCPFSCDVEVIPYYLNYGKYFLYNSIQDYIENNEEQFDLMIYMDHDIIFDCDHNLINFHALYDLLLHTEKGLLAFNHKGDVRHQPEIYLNSLVINEVTLVYPDNISSIACGAFLTLPTLFVEIGKFNVVSIYGLDDHVLMTKLLGINRSSAVLKDIYVTHPEDESEESDIYNQWKVDMILDLINNMLPDYYQQIQSSINLFTTLR